MKGMGITRTRRAFRLEWEETEDGRGTVYLFGVSAIGEYAEERKSFQTSKGTVGIIGKGLSVLTYRSGTVELMGEIAEITYQKERKEKS